MAKEIPLRSQVAENDKWDLSSLYPCDEAWETIQDFIIGFVSFLPMLVVLLLILGVIFLIVLDD